MTNPLSRDAQLRSDLERRRLALQADVQWRMRVGRADRSREVLDLVEQSDMHASEDVDLAVLQMETATLRHIDAALSRLESGSYGYCVSCASDIGSGRLRALPFATRCMRCESSLEAVAVRQRRADAEQPRFFMLSATPEA